MDRIQVVLKYNIAFREWKGCSKKTIAVLVCGLVVLVFSTFLPQLMG